MNRVNRFLCWVFGHKFPNIITLAELFEEHSCSRCGKTTRLNTNVQLIPNKIWEEIIRGLKNKGIV